MAKDVPRRRTRLVLHQFLDRFFAIVIGAYYPDRPWMDGVAITHLASKIVLAQILGHPHSVNGLAKMLRMPRSTLRDWLRELERAGLIEREDEHLLYSGERLGSPEATRVLDELCDLIIEAADQLKWGGVVDE